jgi:hypothetical protein
MIRRPVRKLNLFVDSCCLFLNPYYKIVEEAGSFYEGLVISQHYSARFLQNLCQISILEKLWRPETLSGWNGRVRCPRQILTGYQPIIDFSC